MRYKVLVLSSSFELGNPTGTLCNQLLWVAVVLVSTVSNACGKANTCA